MEDRRRRRRREQKDSEDGLQKVNMMYKQKEVKEEGEGEE